MSPARGFPQLECAQRTEGSWAQPTHGIAQRTRIPVCPGHRGPGIQTATAQRSPTATRCSERARRCSVRRTSVRAVRTRPSALGGTGNLAVLQGVTQILMARPPRGRLLETLTLDTRSAPGVEAAAKSEAHHGMHDMLRGSAWNMLLLTHGSTNKRAPRARGRKWAPGRCLAAPQGRQEHRTDGPGWVIRFRSASRGRGGPREGA